MAGFTNPDAEISAQVDQPWWWPHQGHPSHESVPIVGYSLGSVDVAGIQDRRCPWRKGLLVCWLHWVVQHGLLGGGLWRLGHLVMLCWLHGHGLWWASHLVWWLRLRMSCPRRIGIRWVGSLGDLNTGLVLSLFQNGAGGRAPAVVRVVSTSTDGGASVG